jgi:hypothetical protein
MQSIIIAVAIPVVIIDFSSLLIKLSYLLLLFFLLGGKFFAHLATFLSRQTLQCWILIQVLALFFFFFVTLSSTLFFLLVIRGSSISVLLMVLPFMCCTLCSLCFSLCLGSRARALVHSGCRMKGGSIFLRVCFALLLWRLLLLSQICILDAMLTLIIKDTFVVGCILTKLTIFNDIFLFFSRSCGYFIE